MANISSDLAKARVSAGLTQVQMARKLGLTQARLSQIEHGQNARIDTLQSYARALGLELLLVPQQQLSQVRAMMNRDAPGSTDEDRPSRFPTLAELVPPDASQRHAHPRLTKGPPA